MLKRFLPLFIINTLFSMAAWGQINMLHVTTCGSGAFPGTICNIPATGPGNLIVVAWSANSGATRAAISSMSDNVGNTYVSAGAQAINGFNDVVDIWYAKNSLSGANSVTITPNPSGNQGSAVIWEFSGVDTVSPLDKVAVANNQPATNTPLGASVTTTAPAEVIISAVLPDGTITDISGGNAFTNDFAFAGMGWAHLVTSSMGTYTPQWNSTTLAAYAAATVSFKAAGSGGSGGATSPTSACDLSTPYGIPDSGDVQAAINMSLGIAPCTANIYGSGVCNVVVVQRVINSSLPGGNCITGTGAPVSHSVTLNWVGSSSSNVAGYNIYRSSVSGGPYTKLNSSLVSALTYTDGTVQSGLTYFYVVSAIDSSSNESSYSNQTTAIVPTP